SPKEAKTMRMARPSTMVGKSSGAVKRLNRRSRPVNFSRVITQAAGTAMTIESTVTIAASDRLVQKAFSIWLLAKSAEYHRVDQKEGGKRSTWSPENDSGKTRMTGASR